MVLAALLLMGAAFAQQRAASGTESSGRLYHSDVAALVRQGTALAKQQQFAEAEVPLQEALHQAPNNLDVLRTLGKVESRLGQHTQALQLLEKAVALATHDARVHYELALAQADAGELPLALQQVTTAERLQPAMEKAHLNRARILADMNRPIEAEREFSTAAHLMPHDPQIYYYWALLERSQGNLPKESRLLTMLTRLSPHNARAFYFLGRSLAEQSKRQQAIAALKTAVHLDPRASGPVYLLARELRPVDPVAAEALMQRFQAIRKQDQRLSSLKSLGNEAVRATAQQDWARAIRLFRHAIAQCNGCSIAAQLHKDLGLTLCRAGQVQEGATELRKALKLDPDDTEIVKALQIVDRIESAPDH